MTTTLAPPRPAPAPGPDVRRGRAEQLALAALLVGTAVLYLWNLGASGWANTYYAGAVQAMTQNWTAFFFGSADAGNVVTVDKPPASLWVMALSARVFGLSSWSMLVPQALMGVGTVALLHAAVRRVAGPGAGLIAGVVMALTPVALLMFRFNNPDALLVLLMVAAAYACVRAIENGSTGWLVLVGTLIGFAFLAKMMQAFIVVPALALAYLVAAPTGLARRVGQLLAAGVAVVVAAGWWVAIVELWPSSSRPYIGGSQGDSVLELTLGYNGLGRIFGQDGPQALPAGPPPGVGAPGEPFAGRMGGGGFADPPGPLRLFGESMGTQVAWLLPAALVLLVAGLWLTGRAARTDRVRASLLLWGAWTVVTALVFSFAQGGFHPYYTVALAPGIAALVGIGGVLLWRARSTWPGRAALAVVVAGTGVWAAVLLARTPEFLPGLGWVVLGAAVLAALALLAGPRGQRWIAVTGLVALLTGLAAPAAYAAVTAATPQNGGNPVAGPATGGVPGGGAQRGGRIAMMFSGTADPAVVALLQAAGTTWSAATIGATSSTPLALASGTTVMAIGGFNGGDPAPTLAEFQTFVGAGEVRYFIEGGSARRGESGITTWVRENFAPTTVGNSTIYDLSRPTS